MKRLTLTLLALAATLALSAQVRVTFVGASITEGAGTSDPATRSYPARTQALLGDAWHIENYGVGGCTMLRHSDCPYWTRGRLGEALTSHPDIVLIDLGGNDSKPWNEPAIDKGELVDDAETLVSMFQALPSHPRVILMTPTLFTKDSYGISDGVSQKKVCPALYEAAKRTGCEVLDMYPVLQDAPETLAGDGIHPDDRGAELLAEKVAWYLKAYPEKPAEFMTIDGMADNPFITHLYTADPSAHVWADGRLYVYASHDIDPPRGCDLMDQYHVFSTDDMVHWTDHGEIVRASDVPWGRKEGGFMWAPDAAYRNGKYYFYFPHPSGTHTGSTWKIGVATSDKPASDFKVGGYIKGMTSYYDPCVFVDDDGQAYIYNGGGGQCFGARLKKNMTQLAGKMVPMEGLVDFHEGPWVHKYNGKYYLSYPDNYIDANGKQYNRMHYAMSDNPLGPYEFKGVFMEESPVGCWTNHHSFVEFKGEWYLFYHHNDFSPTFDKNRSVRVDKVYFREDGTIIPVVPTWRGVGYFKSTDELNIDRYSECVGAKIDYLDEYNYFAGWKVRFTQQYDRVRFNDVDFGAKAPKSIVFRAKGDGAVLNVTVGAGKSVAYTIPASEDWTEVVLPAKQGKAVGMQDITAELASGSIEIDWISFR